MYDPTTTFAAAITIANDDEEVPASRVDLVATVEINAFGVDPITGQRFDLHYSDSFEIRETVLNGDPVTVAVSEAGVFQAPGQMNVSVMGFVSWWQHRDNSRRNGGAGNMKHASTILSVCLLAVFLGSHGGARGQTGDSTSKQSGGVVPQTEAAPRLGLPPWAGCHWVVPATRLCDAKGAGINPLTYKLLRDILASGVSGEALCAIDSSLVQTQRDCLSSGRSHDPEMLATLMHLLAHSWKEQRILERADQLYRYAYDILENAGHETSQPQIKKITVLQAWSLLKLERGDLQEAKTLADRQASLAKAEFEAGQFGGIGVLLDALRGCFEKG